MPALSLKLAGALFAGTLAGAAGFTTLTSASTPQLSPASDSTTATTPAVVVESSAPCPAGTVEKDDACVQTLTVPVASSEAPEEDAAEPTEPPAPAAQQVVQTEPTEAPESEAPEAPEAPEQQATSHESEHESDANEVDHEDTQPSGDQAEQESDD